MARQRLNLNIEEAARLHLDPGQQISLDEIQREMMRHMFEEALTQHNGNVRRAAQLLGIGRTTMSMRISAMGLRVRRKGKSDWHNTKWVYLVKNDKKV